jgi:hypothetical protein
MEFFIIGVLIGVAVSPDVWHSSTKIGAANE